MLRFSRLLFDFPRAPDNEDGAPADDLTLDDPVDTEVDQEDDEAVTDPAGEVDAAAAAAPAGDEQHGRAGDTIRSLRSRAQEAERRAEEAARRADDADRRIRDIEARQTRQQPIDPAEEARRLEMMTPDERADYKVNKALERFQQVSAVQNFQTMDRLDQQAFSAKCETSKLAKRFAPDVERELQKIRNDGGNVPREAVLFYVAGRALYEKERGSDPSRGQERIRRQTTRPGNSRGDVGGSRRAASTAEQRLENVPI